jgi:uncharacterized protein involved in exopolysaccharide biosynthesis
MDPAELLDNLTIEQVESTSFIVLTYEDTDPVRAQQIVHTVGDVSSELISERSAAGSQLTANALTTHRKTHETGRRQEKGRAALGGGRFRGHPA